jgi:hypothetical protein
MTDLDNDISDSTRRDKGYYDRLRPKLIAWLAMSTEERKYAGEATNQRAWAKQHGVSERWVNKILHSHGDEVDKLRVSKVVQSGGHLTRTDTDLDALSNAELLADIVRSNLLGAAKGDKSSLDFLRSNPSLLKPLIDAINSEFVSDFEDDTDDELVERFVNGFETELVLELRGRGWTVEKADG